MRWSTIWVWPTALFVLTASGCRLSDKSQSAVQLQSIVDEVETTLYCPAATRIEQTCVRRCNSITETELLPPYTVDDEPPTEFWDLSLEEVVEIALEQKDVLIGLGGRVLTAPEAVPTVYDPAIRESDPRFGTEGALSAFDAQLSTGIFWENNDRVFNNEITGGGINEFQQDLLTYRTELSKVTATGAQFSIRGLTRHDANNSPNNMFPNGGWDTWYELNVRQPLLQGAGVAFNRIAGPNAQPGFNFSNGIMIARVNTDISLADFEVGVINFVSQLEDAYWELYFSYRELDAVILARDSALKTWRGVEAKYQQNLRGGEAYNEARSRAQYYLFQDQVQDAFSGGIYQGERRLRTLMRLPCSDGCLIRPSDEPPTARVVFDWYAILDEALTRRVELRRQSWQVKRRELELLAAKNFTLPRLDAVATYRVRGFGDDLTGNGNRFASAYKDLGSWDHQEWEGGMQLNLPIGFRQGRSAVRHAELRLARERAILSEQERQVATRLGDAFAEIKRAHADIRTGFNRLVAAQQDLDALRAAFDADQITVELLLESQQRLADAQTRYYRGLSDYAVAIKGLHLQKGSLLQYDGVFLSEGSWPRKAYRDAKTLRRRWRPKDISFCITKPCVISRGAYPQHVQEEMYAPAKVEDDLSEEIEPMMHDFEELPESTVPPDNSIQLMSFDAPIGDKTTRLPRP